MKPRYVPFESWPEHAQRRMREAIAAKATATEERIRAQVRESICRCKLEPESITEDGRCGRCYGRRDTKANANPGHTGRRRTTDD